MNRFARTLLVAALWLPIAADALAQGGDAVEDASQLPTAAPQSAAFGPRQPTQLRIVAAAPATAAPNTSVKLLLNRPLAPQEDTVSIFVLEDSWLRVMLGTQRAVIADTSNPRQIEIVLPNDMRPGRPDVVVYEGTRRSETFRGLLIDEGESSRFWPWGLGGGAVIGLVLLGVLLYVRWKTRESDRHREELVAEVKQLQFRLEQGKASAVQVGVSSETRQAGGSAAPPEVPEPPDELVRRCAEQEAVLVVGFGVGANAGLPTWRGTLDQLMDETDGDEILRHEMRVALDEGRSNVVAELISTRLDRGRIAARVGQLFANRLARLPDWYQRLGKIPFTTVVAHGWDVLPDRAFAHRGGSVVASNELEASGQVMSQDFYLLKLNGDPSRPETFRLTEEDYRNFLADTPTFAKLLGTLATSRCLLFLGLSLYNVDTFFSNLRIRVSPSTSAKPHFALVPFERDWEIQRQRMLEKYGVHLIGYEPSPGFPEFTAFVNQLAARVLEAAPAEPRKTRVSSKLTRVCLANIGPFPSLTLDFRDEWNVLLGNNGSGKSTILKAIALGLCGDDPQAASAAGRLLRTGESTGSIELIVGANTYRTHLVRDGHRVHVRSGGLTPLQTGNWVVLGFPPLRGVSLRRLEGPGDAQKPNPVVEDLLPLIADTVDNRLDDVRQWLVNLEVNSNESPSVSKAQAARNRQLRDDFFSAIQRLSPGVTIRPQPLDQNAWEVQVETADGIVPMSQVSQGMSSLFGWIGTLLQRMYEIYPDSPAPTAEPALLLVDEVDAHLHPRWQFELVEAVKKCFPRLQVIATTHSPLVVSGMLASEVLIVERSLDPGVGVQVRQASEDADGLRADQILTSDLFGLPKTRKSVSMERWSELIARENRSDAEQAELAALERRLQRNAVSGSTAEEVAADRDRREEIFSFSVESLLDDRVATMSREQVAALFEPLEHDEEEVGAP